MNLFQKVDFISHSGKPLDFKIECDALTDNDWECIAYLISKKFEWCKVFGVPEGGNKLANALMKYSRPPSMTVAHKYYLLVDDVFTTGGSMVNERKRLDEEEHIWAEDVKGIVLFARGKCPDWITAFAPINPIFL